MANLFQDLKKKNQDKKNNLSEKERLLRQRYTEEELREMDEIAQELTNNLNRNVK